MVRYVRLKSGLLATASAFTVILSAPAIAQEERQTEPPGPVEEADGSQIVVSGIRESLSEAIDRKKSDPRVVDSIVAEDIGKLPDENIAEALRRLTGVAMESEFGVGTGVSIRGLSLNRVEINGRTTLGDTGRQGVNFEDFPSDLVAAIDVIKTPMPSMIEGALGGTIDLRTKRPLDLSKRVISARVEGEYGDLADKLGYRASGQVGDNWETGIGTFGALLNLSWEDRTLRSDSTRENLRTQEIGGERVVWPEDPSLRSRNLDRQRLGGNLSLQWAPLSNAGNVYLDLAYTNFKQNETSYGFFTSDSGIDSNRDYTVNDAPEALASPYIDRNMTFRSFASVSPRVTETWSGALGGEFEIARSLTLKAEASYAKSDSRRSDQSVQAAFANPNDLQSGSRSGAPEEIRFNSQYTFNGYGSVPDWSPIPGEFTSGSGSRAISLPDSEVDFSDPNLYAFRNFRDRVTDTNNTEFATRVDLTYENATDGWLSFIRSVDIGARVTERTNKFRDYNTNVDNFHRDLLDADGNPVFFTLADMADYGFGYSEVPYQVFPGSEGSYITDNWVGFDTSFFQSNGIDSTRKAFNDFTQGQGLTRRNGDPVSIPAFPELIQSSVSDAKENTYAGYAQANLDTMLFGIPMQGVAGARVVHTKFNIDGFGTDENGQVVPRSGGSSYTDILPSVNLKFAMAPDLLVRLGYGRVLRRPDFADLSPGLICNSNFTRCDIGNVDLDPFRAVQYDISAEWYFAKDSLFNVAIFYKDVKAFFKNTILCLNEPDIIQTLGENPGILTNAGCRLSGSTDPIKVLDDGDPTVPLTPLAELGIKANSVRNGESGKVKGIELGLQAPLGNFSHMLDGFGFVANYTYADSEDPNGVPLEDISKHTINLIGYFEKGPISLRAAYTRRSRFLERTGEARVADIGVDLGAPDDPTRGNSYREPIEQLDLSASYDITRRITATLGVVNATDEKEVYTSALGHLYAWHQVGRRYTFGLRGSF